MKDVKLEEKSKTNAEKWVEVARIFGEKCMAIQNDPKLNANQKLEKQKSLSTEMAKEIQEDKHLNSEDKKMMLTSIKNYQDEWKKMNDFIQNPSAKKK